MYGCINGWPFKCSVVYESVFKQDSVQTNNLSCVALGCWTLQTILKEGGVSMSTIQEDSQSQLSMEKSGNWKY